MLKKTKVLIFQHKFISAITIIVIILAAYFGYKALAGNKSATSYVTADATKGTITTSVSGSGQVSAASTVNLQFSASGTLIYLPVKNGDAVYAGQLIAELDTTDAQKTVRNADSSLQSSQIALEKLQGSNNPAIPQNEQNAQNALSQDYQSGYNTVSGVFTDLPAIMTDLQNIDYGNSFNNTQFNIDFYALATAVLDPSATQYRDDLAKSYKIASDGFTKNFSDYKATTRYSDNATVDAIISETYNTTKDIAQAIKDTSDLIQFYKATLAKYDIKGNPIADTQLAIITADSSKANSDIVSLLNTQNTLKNDKDAVVNAGLDLQSQELSLQNSKNSLQDAKDALANYYIYAPFAGTVGKITAQAGSQVGSGTAIATLLTAQKICTIPLNEVDVSKVQPGQKVVLTFDALPDLSVAGQVATIDPVGTVTQGVVTYNVQISFDTQDPRVKSGMSINAQIITNVKQDVLLAPSSAVKTQGSTKYVQVLVNNAPAQKIVTTGLVNDTNTEILSGLNEGDKVVTQTITSGATSASTTRTSTSNSALRIPGLTGGGFRGN